MDRIPAGAHLYHGAHRGALQDLRLDLSEPFSAGQRLPRPLRKGLSVPLKATITQPKSSSRATQTAFFVYETMLRLALCLVVCRGVRQSLVANEEVEANWVSVHQEWSVNGRTLNLTQRYLDYWKATGL